MNWWGVETEETKRNARKNSKRTEENRRVKVQMEWNIFFLFFVVGLVTKQALTGFDYGEKNNSIELVIESHNTICTLFDCFARTLHHAVYIYRKRCRIKCGNECEFRDRRCCRRNCRWCCFALIFYSTGIVRCSTERHTNIHRLIEISIEIDTQQTLLLFDSK